MVRPFYPGGDYEHEAYPAGCCVVDNPPFSILSQIVDFYVRNNVPFFLFAPGLTALGHARHEGVCFIGVKTSILYENGATINCCFLTSLEGPETLIRVADDLSDMIQEADEANRATVARTLPKYSYPDNVLTGAQVQYLAAHHTGLKIRRADAYFIRALDAQREAGVGLFGSGFLLSSAAAAEKAAAEKAAAEKAAAEKAAAERWVLSDRERAIIAALDAGQVPSDE